MTFVDSACPESRLRNVCMIFLLILGHVIDTSVEIGSPFIQSVARVVTSTVEEQPSECGASYGCPTSTGNDNFNYTVWMELMRAKFVDVQCPTYAPCNYT